ncbi:nuclear pore complex protein Nup205 [Planococcus citri]|uniref:nuclear pore complex protein Nup205 n=1 Tax=Planococcus citri TaxID=170843 RepID=UPI0031FA1E07
MEDCVLDMWTPYKQLCSTVEKCIIETSDACFGTLQATFSKYKQNFLNVLKNPPKNGKSRLIVKKSESEGIRVAGIEYHTVPKDMVEEALILSDMYDLDELMALDLLTTAQHQMPSYPGLPRGLVAVLLYYDGHKALATTLRTIMQARSGFHWTVDISSNIPDYLAKYSDELINEGLLEKVITALKNLDLQKEIEMLQRNRALGGPKHHHTVVVLFEEIRQILADIIFLYSAQAGLYQQSLFMLINFLRTLKIESDVSGGIDNVTLALQMALLFAIDVNDVIKREDSEEIITKVPLLCENGFLENLIHEAKNPNKKWECTGLQAMMQFALGVTVASLRNTSVAAFPRGITDEDDSLVSLALNNGVFSFAYSTFIRNEVIQNEEFYMRRIHSLFTDFIVLMPLKVKELRVRAEEISRTTQIYQQEGLNPPGSLEHHFELMLKIMIRLYSRDPLGLKLHLDFWFDDSIKTSKSISIKKFSQQVSLFKFLKQTGDSLPPALFVAYLELISSLAACPDSARQAFKLFKCSDVSTLTWDHFFKSFHKYYNNLRLEQPAISDTMYRHRSLYPKGINPMEIQGLQAVLSVIRHISEHDDISRLAFCENLEWSCISILLGLVTCSIDVSLKADIVLTLSALAKSPEIGNIIWKNLETTQVIPTVPTTNNYQPRGVQAELEEVESKNEEFPLTRAVLNLINVLIDNPMPRLLGAGSRTPGFDPYLNYVLRAVFLRFNSRSYKNPSEKWEVGNLCVKLALKFLKQYDPRVEDFTGLLVQTEDGGSMQICPHPGFHIMINLCSSSEFFRVIMYLVDEGCRMLDAYKEFAGKKSFETLLLSCLELLYKGLEMQARFLDLLSLSNSDRILIPLHQLLSGINARTGNPDHLLNIAKYVTYNSWLPMHTLTAVNILLAVTSYPIKHSTFLPFFTSTISLQTTIRHGFVESLEAEENQWNDGNELSVTGKIKEAIMKLLIQCLPASGVNLAHYLLGFNLKNIKKTILQTPGPGFPRTCFHSILTLLNTSLLYRKDKAVLKVHPQLVQLAYKIIYTLCANPNTSDSVLRFLRLTQDFVQQHMALFPFKTYDKVTEFICMAWILKIFAIELRVISSMGHNNKLEDLIKLFLYHGTGDFFKPRKGPNVRKLINGEEEVTSLISTRLFQLMSVIEFEKEPPTMPSWQFFDAAQVQEVLAQCEFPVAGMSPKHININMLFSILQEELASIQGSSTSGQRQLIQQEVQELLTFTMKLNEYRKLVGAQVQYFDAWRKLCNVYFIVAPANIVPFQLRFSLLMELIRSLLQTVNETESPSEEMKIIASEAILLLVVDIRQCVKAQKRLLNEGTRKSVLSQLQTFENYSSEILNVLKNWIVLAGNSSKKVKINLFACFLTFLHFCTDKDEPEVECWLENIKQESGDVDYSNINSSQMFRVKLLNSDYKDQLLKIFCEDATAAHDIWKMTALSGLQMLVDADPNHISFIASHGYLKCLIQTLVESDIKLCKLFNQDCQLAPLFVYETEMTFMCKIASYPIGAEALLDAKILSALSTMDVYNYHPTVAVCDTSNSSHVDFIPDVSTRYLQLFTPVLTLCNTIITSVGVENEDAVVQIMQLLFSLNETVSLVLRSASPNVMPQFIKELADLTAVISAVFGHGLTQKFKEEYHSERAVQIHKIQKLMLSLFTTFQISESAVKKVGDNVDAENKDPIARSQTIVHYFQVIINSLFYAQSIVSGAKMDRYISISIFQPTLNELAKNKKSTSSIIGVGNTQELDLGIAVRYVLDGVTYYTTQLDCISKLKSKLECIPAMTTDEVKQIMFGDTIRVPETEYKNEVSLQLMKLIVEKKRELDMCFVIMETALYLLWAHLDYFTLQCIPTIGSSMADSSRNVSSSKFGESGRVCTVEQLNEIKQALIPTFNENFSNKLMEITKNQTTSEKGYVEALLRRIKKLIQFVPNK